MFFCLLFVCFVGSAWSFGFFIRATTANDLRLWRIFYPKYYPLHLFSYPYSWERASMSLFNVECSKQGNYWYHFYNVFGVTRSLTGDWTGDLPHSMPALYHWAIEKAVNDKNIIHCIPVVYNCWRNKTKRIHSRNLSHLYELFFHSSFYTRHVEILKYRKPMLLWNVFTYFL